MLKAIPAMQKTKRDAMVGVMIPSSIKAELEQIAERDQRSMSFVAGALLERGLELFRRDGLLRPKTKDNKLDVFKATTEEVRRKKLKQ